MTSRRDFLKKAAALTASGGLAGMLPESILRALAIDPAVGSTFLDAEHVVILMQENRSFDHSYGTLRGVRGFNDPRAVTLPNGLPVWLQTNYAGETYAPFRLNLKDSNATWMGSLPHGWTDQSDARNAGKHDRWLEVKPSGKKAYAKLPLTLGHYTRDDIPFYYALADAFTICDQNFCSSLTGTTPNRLHLWTGTIRSEPKPTAKACVRNEDSDPDTSVSWTTFPERLEDAGISWRIYQNDLTIPTGFTGPSEAWLANYGDNPIEYFSQFQVRFAPSHRRFLTEILATYPAEITKLEAAPQTVATVKQLRTLRARLDYARQGREKYNDETFAKLPAREKSLHERAFTINTGDPDYRELAKHTYQDGAQTREMLAPKGDVFHQFRKDVNTGTLPAVSWLVAPENFSDHPSAPWYGAWYVSEALDILTKNPEVWKKTIFILCYDENDGYFDHVPPFVAPDPGQPDTGKASPAIDPALEHVRWSQERVGVGRAGPIGLGYRVPLVIASPWSRGGYINSEVSDHTSILKLLEKWLTHKTGKPVREPNITSWRRAMCGDLSSVFRPYHGEKIDLPKPVERLPFLESIHGAQFKQGPTIAQSFTAQEIEQFKTNPASKSPRLPRQEAGTRPSCPLPYELTVDGALSTDRQSFAIRFAAGNKRFGANSAGAPFHVYTPAPLRTAGAGASIWVPGRAWAYAVAPGELVDDAWRLADFQDGFYDLRVHGPNGFFRHFRGTADDPFISILVEPAPITASAPASLNVFLTNRDPKKACTLLLADPTYRNTSETIELTPAETKDAKRTLTIDCAKSAGWHALLITSPASPKFLRHYAARLETGQESTSDPAMA
jgi:phospholipase C